RSASVCARTADEAGEGGRAKTPPRRPPRAMATAVAPPTRSFVLRLTSGLPPAPRLAVSRVLVAAVGRGDVREVSEERVLVRVDTVADRVVRRQVAEPERAGQDRSVPAGDGPDLDVRHVVGEATTVREALEVARERSQRVRVRGRRNGRVQA